MYDILEGVKVVEVASWLFGPACGAVLADWGADVIKIEPVKKGGDPYRGFFNTGSVNATLELANRGKRSVALDLSSKAGRDALMKIVAEADVYVTSLLPSRRKKLGLDIDDVRAVNPSIIFVRASGYGPRGPNAGTGGFDVAAAWARSGISQFITSPEANEPVPPPGGIGDCVGGLTGAGAVAGALFKRERTGKPSVVDVSLLHSSLWMSATVLSLLANAGEDGPRQVPVGRANARNPLMNSYKTKDGRWLWMAVIQPDPKWPNFCEHIERPDLLEDPRFGDFRSRMENSRELIQILDDVFAARTLNEWKEKLKTFDGVWDPVQTPEEVLEDPQVLANEFMAKGVEPGPALSIVSSPAQFDEEPLSTVRRAPEHGQHTEEVLLEVGCTWDEISALKDQGAVI